MGVYIPQISLLLRFVEVGDVIPLTLLQASPEGRATRSSVRPLDHNCSDSRRKFALSLSFPLSDRSHPSIQIRWIG